MPVYPGATVCPTKKGTLFSLVEELVVVIVVPVVVLIVVIVVPVAALFFIPLMVVGNLAVIAIPVAVKVLLAIMMRCHPGGAVVGWTGPVSFVPPVAITFRVLVAGHPNIPCAGTWWLRSHYTVRRRRADSDPDGNLSEDRSRSQQHQYKQLNLHDLTPFHFDCVVNANYEEHVAGPRYMEYGSASPGPRCAGLR